MEEKMLSNGNFSLEYETERLILRVLTPEYANEVAAFQADNRTIFEKYEPSRPEDFYTPEHQQLILKAEFNQALRMSTIRYYVFLKSNPWSIIGTVCLHDIRRLSYSCCEIGYKFDSKFTDNSKGLKRKEIREFSERFPQGYYEITKYTRSKRSNYRE